MDLSCDYLIKNNDLWSEAHHCAKSTLGKLKNWLAIVGSPHEKFLDLVAIPSEQLGANLVQ